MSAPGTLTSRIRRLPRVASWRTWAITIPPLLRAAMAIASISPWTASPSIVRLPSSSAVVPRMTATSIGNAWYSSHSRPRSVTTSTRSSVVPRVLLAAGLARVDVRAQPDVRDEPRPSGGDLAHELREDALRERVRLDLVRLDERAEARLVADVAADRPPHQPGQAELREAAVGEVADADDADRGQVARPALLGVDRGQLVDEPLRQRVAGPGAADQHRAAVADEPDRLADVDDLAHGM